jgi:hypothetical protein
VSETINAPTPKNAKTNVTLMSSMMMRTIPMIAQTTTGDINVSDMLSFPFHAVNSSEHRKESRRMVPV